MNRPMKLTTLLLLTLGVCGLSSSKAQVTPVELSFGNPLLRESEFVRATAQLQKIGALEASVSGKIAGREYQFDCIHVVDGKQTRTSMRMPFDVPFVCKSDTLRFQLVSQSIGTDSVCIVFTSPIARSCFFQIAGANQCIPMETISEKALTTADPIPVMAFCQGEPVEFPMENGAVFHGLHYCSVRDGHIHPSKWHARFKLKDYVYFEIKLTDNPAKGIK